MKATQTLPSCCDTTLGSNQGPMLVFWAQRCFGVLSVGTARPHSCQERAAAHPRPGTCPWHWAHGLGVHMLFTLYEAPTEGLDMCCAAVDAVETPFQRQQLAGPLVRGCPLSSAWPCSHKQVPLCRDLGGASTAPFSQGPCHPTMDMRSTEQSNLTLPKKRKQLSPKTLTFLP